MPCAGCERRKAKLKALAARAARAMGLAPASRVCVCGHLELLHVTKPGATVGECMGAEWCRCEYFTERTPR